MKIDLFQDLDNVPEAAGNWWAQTTLRQGKWQPPKQVYPKMPHDSGSILRGCPLLGGAICLNVVSMVEEDLDNAPEAARAPLGHPFRWPTFPKLTR